MAVIKKDHHNALVALTSAALSLPGLSVQAAVPASGIKANVSYGHYQESDGRMQVDVYHADAVIPLSDRLELAFSFDRDTYSGATPAFSIPASMAYQPKYKQKSDGTLATDLSNVDVISSASSGVSASGLTILGGLNGFKAFEDYKKTAEAKITFESEQANQVFINQLNAAKDTINQSVASAIVPFTELKNTAQANLDQNYTQNKQSYDNQYPIDKQPIEDTHAASLNNLDMYYADEASKINAELPLLAQEYANNINILNTTKTQAEQNLETKKNTALTGLNNAKTAAESNYINSNPRPADPDSISSAVSIKFSPDASNPNGMQYSAYSGSSNITPMAGGNCTGSGPSGCFYENGMVVGIVRDSSNPIAHLHRGGSSSNRRMSYHSDSAGVYIRSLNSQAFSLDSMDFKSPINDENPDNDANDYWEILGFSQAENLDLDKGDGTNYATRVAYQTIANGFNGSLSLNGDFKNIKAFWIHYRGYPQTPADGKQFGMELDNINISPVVVPTAQQTQWDSDLQRYTTEYKLTVYDPEKANIDTTYTQQKSAIQTNYDAQKLAFDEEFQRQSEALAGENQQELEQLKTAYNNEKQKIDATKLGDLQKLDDQYAKAYAELLTKHQDDTVLLNNTYEAKKQEIDRSYDNERQAVDANYQTERDKQNKLDAKLTKQAHIAAYAKLLNSKIPVGTPTVQRFQIQPQETRNMPQFTGKYYFDTTTLAASGGFSDEPDFLSNFGSINISHEFNDKLTTLSGGYGITSNTITRGEMGHAAHSGAGHDHYGAADYAPLKAESTFHSFNTSLSQVFSKNTLFQSTASFTRQSGYLSNPYKFVYIRGEITPEEYNKLWSDGGDVNWNDITQLEVVGTELFREARPDKRNIFSLSNQLNQYLPELDASIHFDYRFYTDDWNINSHTFELKWFQSLPGGFTVTPGIRYYSQSDADFFAPYFLSPRADGHYSSDFRLSAFGDLSGGVTVSKEFARGITLEAGIEYTTHAGDLKLGGGGVGDYADFNYYMAHANLNVDLSARPFNSSEHAGHDMHRHQHGTPIPAGVMFAHMMNQADDIMVGYRYQYAVQNGAMLQGNHKISDTHLISNACQSNPSGCLYKPVQMQMQMHMLDLMYAPTDWLNIMVMPQLMSMEMDMSQPLRAFAASEESAYGHHAGTTHTSNDIGDTLVTALVKVADQDGHHLHAGIGMSAPTGGIDAELSPGKLKSADGTEIESGSAVLQDYGMQLGSGTWDFKPSLTYSGQIDNWGWGVQLNGTKRLGINKYDYAYGDIFQATGWGSYSVFDWLSATVRGVYTWQDKIQGQSNQTHENVTPVDFTNNYGGRFWDIGLGFNVSLPAGKFAGHNVNFEWLHPVATDFNGSQLEREGALTATWSFSF